MPRARLTRLGSFVICGSRVLRSVPMARCRAKCNNRPGVRARSLRPLLSSRVIRWSAASSTQAAALRQQPGSKPPVVGSRASRRLGQARHRTVAEAVLTSSGCAASVVYGDRHRTALVAGDSHRPLLGFRRRGPATFNMACGGALLPGLATITFICLRWRLRGGVGSISRVAAVVRRACVGSRTRCSLRAVGSAD